MTLTMCWLDLPLVSCFTIQTGHPQTKPQCNNNYLEIESKLSNPNIAGGHPAINPQVKQLGVPVLKGLSGRQK